MSVANDTEARVVSPKGPLPEWAVLPKADFQPMAAAVEALAFQGPAGKPAFYPGPMIGAGELGAKIAGDGHYLREGLALMRRLQPDDYLEYLIAFYEAGLIRFGEHWGYADIVTALLGLADALQPQSYLEIGVRRGRSVCAVGSRAPHCAMTMFDMWLANYAGMDNPGPELVKAELAKVGHKGPLEFVNGNSHDTVPAWFAANPDAAFDIITVDGDHTNLGAAQDLVDVMPRLKIGGALVFDDICHPKHPGLKDVWRRLIEEDRRFTVYNFTSVGYGVGFAIRRY